MIARFSLYGFLKNLRFFEPFFLLFLRAKGLSFLEIGLLFSFREICINLMEIPSGALADLYGRKSIMIFSLASYIVSFAVFGLVSNVWLLYAAMFFFAIGEAFRTGTHKAMIFDWLRHEGREKEKTKVYGYTRSWSQIGSAVSVLIAGVLVFYSGRYDYVFWFSIIPYLAGLWNIAMYPSWLDQSREKEVKLGKIFSHLFRAMGSALKKGPVRGLILQSMIFTGNHKAIKDYLQIIIKSQIVLIPLAVTLSEAKRTAVLIAVVYFVLYILTSFASKYSFKTVEALKGKSRAVLGMLVLTVLILGACAWATYFEIYWIPITGFVLIYAVENAYRPILLSSFDDCADSQEQATVLSIESQAVSAGVFFIAPLIGFAADRFGLATVFSASAVILSLYLVMHIWSLKGIPPAKDGGYESGCN